MSSSAKGDPHKRHRHDVGDVSSGPASHESLTRGIQGVLTLCIVLTAALVIFVLVASRAP